MPSMINSHVYLIPSMVMLCLDLAFICNYIENPVSFLMLYCKPCHSLCWLADGKRMEALGVLSLRQVHCPVACLCKQLWSAPQFTAGQNKEVDLDSSPRASVSLSIK